MKNRHDHQTSHDHSHDQQGKGHDGHHASHSDCAHVGREHIGHSHSHSHVVEMATKPSRAFQISIVFNILFVVIEFYYGFVSQSLALLGDALHNLGDVFALVLSWIGFYLAKSKGSEKLTFGWKKFSILAAFFNAATLVLTSLYIIFEAYERYQNPTSQNSVTIMVVAGVGFVINLSTGLLFHGSHKHDLNLKSAYLHLLGDALVSLGVLVAGVVIYFYKWDLIDPIVSVIISLIILLSTWGLFKESWILLLNGVPQHVSYKKVNEFLQKYEGVVEIEQLRIWALSTSEFALTARLKAQSGLDLNKLIQQLKNDFHIHDVTVQTTSASTLTEAE